MDEQFKPIDVPQNEQSTNGFTAIKPEEPKPTVVNNGPVPNNDILKNLPEWNLEPPVEINRGNS